MKAAIVVLSFASSLHIVGIAVADDVDVAGASKAFSSAQQAHFEGQYSRAADLFELADNLAPSPVALRSAARSRFAAGHFSAAATHAAELLRRYPDERQSREIAEELLEKLGPELARVTVVCSAICRLEVGARAVATGSRREHTFFVRPGPYEIVATFADDKRARKSVSPKAKDAIKLLLDAPKDVVATVVPIVPVAVVANPPAPRSRRVAVQWVVGAGVVTAGFGVAATVAGVLTLNARDNIRTKVAAGDVSRAVASYEDAERKQLMTNIFLVGAAAAAVTTLTLAYFTDWGDRSELRLAPARGGGAVSLGRRF